MSISTVHKIVFYGDEGVGVNSLVKTALGQEVDFADTPKSKGIEFYVNPVMINGNEVKAQIWASDTTFTGTAVFRIASGVLLCYDVTNKQSFNNIKGYLIKANEIVAKNTVRYIVATKSDLADKSAVDVAEARKFATENGCKYIETSAKNRTNTQDLIQNITQEIFDTQPVQVDRTNVENPSLHNFGASRKKIRGRMGFFALGGLVSLAASAVFFAIGAGAIRCRLGIHGYWLGALATITSIGCFTLLYRSKKVLNSLEAL